MNNLVNLKAVEEKVEMMNELIQEQGLDVTLDAREVLKNDSMKVAITVRRKGCNLAPTVYMDDELMGKSDEDLLSYLLAIVDGRPGSFKVEEFITKEYILDHVLPRLRDGSKCYLLAEGGVAFKQFLDFAITYYIDVKVGDEHGTIQLTDELIKQVGLTLDEVNEAALSNLDAQVRVDNIASLLSEMMGVEVDDSLPMWVISNQSKVFGAASILSAEALSKVEDHLGRRFYILPSSVHEAICCDADLDPQGMLEMVMSVNSTEVSPEDKLIDGVYLYDEGIVRKVA